MLPMISVQYRGIHISKIHRVLTGFVDIVYDRPYLVLLSALAILKRRSVILRDCLHALSCCSTRHTPRNVEFSCLLLRSDPALLCQWTAGRAVLISSSSYGNSSDLATIHMMSVKYASILSLVVCLYSASDASVFAGLGLNQPGQRSLNDTAGPQACRLELIYGHSI
jgi:hypothetical protein